ncbi:MAG: T9SS type A sorting domain-containing protein [Chitinophagaceae bacterium]|nr:T9SS type A sorting domain-containing protein [Chitinophagaceae bacterium]
MIRKLLLLLVTVLYLQFSFAQQVSVLGNVIWDNTTERIKVRIAIRNNSNSATNCEIAAMRIGYQFNETVLSYDGFKSYFYNGSNESSGLNDITYLTSLSGMFDPDHAAPYDDGTRLSGSKILRKNYINRSTTLCGNLWTIPGNTYRVAFDLYFKFKPGYYPADYGLTTAGSYGFNTPNFIAQFISDLNQTLSDAKKEIAVVIDHSGSSPYQPFDQSGSSCNSGNLNPLPITDNSLGFINPINGVLSAKFEQLNVIQKSEYISVEWQVDNIDKIHHYEIERREESGTFRTIGSVISADESSAAAYYFKDKISTNGVKLYYRIKAVSADQSVMYSDIKMIRPVSMAANTVKIFPNPTTDFIQFNAPPDNGNYLYRIYNSEGKLTISGNAIPSNSRLNIRNLKTGSYFIELYDPVNGKRLHSQFSKQ